MVINTHPHFNDIIIFTPEVYHDYRGFFMESYNDEIYNILNINFVQDNHSKSFKNVLRGLHYQWNKPVSKLFKVIYGGGAIIFLDIKQNSPTYGQHGTLPLISEGNVVFIPYGYAVGFVSYQDESHLYYKCSNKRNAKQEGSIYPLNLGLNLGIDNENIILSDKDKYALTFEEYKTNPKFV